MATADKSQWADVRYLRYYLVDHRKQDGRMPWRYNRVCWGAEALILGDKWAPRAQFWVAECRGDNVGVTAGGGDRGWCTQDRQRFHRSLGGSLKYRGIGMENSAHTSYDACVGAAAPL